MKTGPLGHLAERMAEMHRIYSAADQRLGENRLIADDSELDFVSLRYQPPVV